MSDYRTRCLGNVLVLSNMDATIAIDTNSLHYRSLRRPREQRTFEVFNTSVPSSEELVVWNYFTPR